MHGFFKFFGGMDQGLGRNAADVQAGTAELLALDQGGGDAKLGGTDGGNIAAGAAADNQ